MRLRALPPDLVLRGDSEPDADALLVVRSLCVHRPPLPGATRPYFELSSRSVSRGPALRPQMLPAGLWAVVRGHNSSDVRSSNLAVDTASLLATGRGRLLERVAGCSDTLRPPLPVRLQRRPRAPLRRLRRARNSRTSSAYRRTTGRRQCLCGGRTE